MLHNSAGATLNISVCFALPVLPLNVPELNRSVPRLSDVAFEPCGGSLSQTFKTDPCIRFARVEIKKNICND